MPTPTWRSATCPSSPRAWRAEDPPPGRRRGRLGTRPRVCHNPAFAWAPSSTAPPPPHAPRCPATPTPIAPPGDLTRRLARPPARVPHYWPSVAERRSQRVGGTRFTSLVSFTEHPERHSA